jgi:hypothetical protein
LRIPRLSSGAKPLGPTLWSWTRESEGTPLLPGVRTGPEAVKCGSRRRAGETARTGRPVRNEQGGDRLSIDLHSTEFRQWGGAAARA